MENRKTLADAAASTAVNALGRTSPFIVPRAPNPEVLKRANEIAKKREIAAWNAEVENKRRVKKDAKKIRDTFAKGKP